METQFEISVYGRVQGVGFRYAARNQARSLNLKGWIKNLPEGSVHTIIQGKTADCHAFIQWCRNGPGYSWVERLEITEQKPEPMPPFQVRY